MQGDNFTEAMAACEDPVGHLAASLTSESNNAMRVLLKENNISSA